MSITSEKLQELLEWKSPSHSWRPYAKYQDSRGTFWQQYAAYLDGEELKDVLDLIIGPENWKIDYDLLNETLTCRLSLHIGGEWIAKTDAAVLLASENYLRPKKKWNNILRTYEDDGISDEREMSMKGAYTDAFKRACSTWGVGRYVKSLPKLKLEMGGQNNKDTLAPDGSKLYTTEAKNEMLNHLLATGGNQTGFATPQSIPTQSGGAISVSNAPMPSLVGPAPAYMQQSVNNDLITEKQVSYLQNLEKQYAKVSGSTIENIQENVVNKYLLPGADVTTMARNDAKELITHLIELIDAFKGKPTPNVTTTTVPMKAAESPELWEGIGEGPF